MIDFLTNQIGSNGIFFALFVYLFYTGKKEGTERETKLQKNLEQSQELLGKFAEKYDIIIDRLDKLEGNRTQRDFTKGE